MALRYGVGWGDGDDVPVATGNHDRVGTLGVGHVEEPLPLVDGLLGRSLGQEVGGEASRVRASNALDPDVAGVGRLKGGSEGGPDTGALCFHVSKFHTRR